jgi:hypothetical protein
MTGFWLLAKVKRSASVIGVCLAVLGAGVGLAGQAQAAPLVPAAPQASAAGAVRPAMLSGVSCVRPSWCLAVGTAFGAHGASQDLAEIWNGTSWRLLASPPGTGLASVACSATWYCLTFGRPARETPAFQWNGHKWLKIAEPRGASSVPSCASRTMCVIGNSYSQSVLSWNGKKWTNSQMCGGGASAVCVTSTACASASLCMAVGAVRNEIYVENASASLWDGKQWANSFLPNAEDGGTYSTLNDVSCAGQSCLALGTTDYEWDNTTQTWQDVTPTNGVSTLGRALSCSSGTECMVIGYDPVNAWWHDGTWTATQFAPSGKHSLFSAVSCKSGSCVAVGSDYVAGKQGPIAESWNGTAWKLIAPKAPAG